MFNDVKLLTLESRMRLSHGNEHWVIWKNVVLGDSKDRPGSHLASAAAAYSLIWKWVKLKFVTFPFLAQILPATWTSSQPRWWEFF